MFFIYYNSRQITAIIFEFLWWSICQLLLMLTYILNLCYLVLISKHEKGNGSISRQKIRRGYMKADGYQHWQHSSNFWSQAEPKCSVLYSFGSAERWGSYSLCSAWPPCTISQACDLERLLRSYHQRTWPNRPR